MAAKTCTAGMLEPQPFRDLLLEFTICSLLDQPSDLVQFGVDFFCRMKHQRRTALKHGGVESDTAMMAAVAEEAASAARDDSGSGDEVTSTGTSRSSGSSTASDGERSDADGSSSQLSSPPPEMAKSRQTRRQPVYAEAYNPEEDDESDAAQKVVVPKTDEQKESLRNAVKNILLFRALDPEQMLDVIDAMFEVTVKTGDLVIRQGDDGDNFYVISEGEFSVWINGNRVFSYSNSGSFGELALLYNMPRSATVKAESEGRLWAMDRATFRRIVLKSSFRKRKLYEQLIESVPMLKELENYERMNLCDALVPRALAAGETAIRQGEEADGMYFVETGEVVITVRVEGKEEEVELLRLGKGGYFGELALVTQKPRAATVRAATDCRLAFLDVEAFERVLGPCMAIMKRNITDYDQQMERIFGKHAAQQ